MQVERCGKSSDNPPTMAGSMAMVLALLFCSGCGLAEKIEKKKSSPVTTAAATPTPPPTLALPSTPMIASAVAGDAQVAISWSSAAGADSYNLYWSSGSAASTGSTELVNVSSPYVQTGLKNGSTYHYVLTAVGPGGESPPSTDVSATPAASP